MASPFFQKIRRTISAIILFSFFVTFATTNASKAAVIWSETLYDADSDYGIGYYTDIWSISLGTVDDNYDSVVALIEPYNNVSTSFFSSGGVGSVALDVNLDSVTDFTLYAPNAYIDKCDANSE